MALKSMSHGALLHSSSAQWKFELNVENWYPKMWLKC